MGFWVNFPDWSAFSQKLISLPLCVTFYSERNDMEEEGDELVLSLSASYVRELPFLLSDSFFVTHSLCFLFRFFV